MPKPKSGNFNISPQINSDCQNCTKRRVGCHATCKSYQEYRETLDDINSKRQKSMYVSRISHFAYKKS